MQNGKPILYFCDPVGVTEGYQSLFSRLSKQQANPVSLYRVFSKEKLLHYRGNRKAPGYSIDLNVIWDIQHAIQGLIDRYQPRLIVTSDPATLFLCVDDYESAWNWMTIENARGGVYEAFGFPLLVTYPLTAWYNEIRERDIASANQGFGNEEDFERAHASYNIVPPVESSVGEGDESGSVDEEAEAAVENEESNAGEDAVFFHPIKTKVQVGKFCLESDWRKVHRLLAGMKESASTHVQAEITKTIDTVVTESSSTNKPPSIRDIHKRLMMRNKT